MYGGPVPNRHANIFAKVIWANLTTVTAIQHIKLFTACLHRGFEPWHYRIAGEILVRFLIRQIDFVELGKRWPE